MTDFPTQEFALYHINEVGSPVDSACTLPFVAARYSCYKYGSTSAGNAFAYALGDAFHYAFPQLVNSPSLFVASSPYKYVPTAAYALARTFFHYLNHLRNNLALPPAQLIKIERRQTSSGDYGLLSLEQRHALMHSNPVSLQQTLPRNADLIIIDDIKVTGAHQNRLIRATETQTLSSRTFLYVLKLLNPSPEMLNPAIEDHLNHSFVKNLNDFVDVALAPDFTWNVRVCKFLLNAKNRSALPAFLAHMPASFLLKLYQNSLGDGYNFMNAYQESHMIVQTALLQRQLLDIQDGGSKRIANYDANPP